MRNYKVVSHNPDSAMSIVVKNMVMTVVDLTAEAVKDLCRAFCEKQGFKYTESGEAEATVFTITVPGRSAVCEFTIQGAVSNVMCNEEAVPGKECPIDVKVLRDSDYWVKKVAQCTMQRLQVVAAFLLADTPEELKDAMDRLASKFAKVQIIEIDKPKAKTINRGNLLPE